MNSFIIRKKVTIWCQETCETEMTQEEFLEELKQKDYDLNGMEEYFPNEVEFIFETSEPAKVGYGEGNFEVCKEDDLANPLFTNKHEVKLYEVGQPLYIDAYYAGKHGYSSYYKLKNTFASFQEYEELDWGNFDKIWNELNRKGNLLEAPDTMVVISKKTYEEMTEKTS